MIEFPRPVVRLIRTLNEAGYEAYAVGGCVRDALLGRQPNDWDLTTSALPEQIKACFANRRVIETGIKHGTGWTARIPTIAAQTPWNSSAT